MTTKAQLAQYCADHFPTQITHSGASLTQFIIGGVAVVIAFVLGWYIKGRGMTGVKIDLNNVKTDVENIKSKIFPSTPAVAAATPVV